MNENLSDIENNYYAELCYSGDVSFQAASSGFKKLSFENGSMQKTLYGFDFLNDKLTVTGTQSGNYTGSLLATASHGESEIKTLTIRIQNGSEIKKELSFNVAGLQATQLFSEFEMELSSGDELELLMKFESENLKITNVKWMLICKNEI